MSALTKEWVLSVLGAIVVFSNVRIVDSTAEHIGVSTLYLPPAYGSRHDNGNEGIIMIIWIHKKDDISCICKSLFMWAQKGKTRLLTSRRENTL